MANKLIKVDNLPGALMFDCPGCKCSHQFFVEGIRNNPGYENTPVWNWNKSMDKPTFKPSLLVRWTEGVERTPKVCHSFVTDGFIQYLGDCTHQLANKTIEIPNIDETI